VFEKRFSVYLVSRSVLEKRLAFYAGEDVLWDRTSRDVRHVVRLSSGREEACAGVYEGLLRDFGPFLVRAGDDDFVPALLNRLRKERLVLVTAESCTGGLIAKLLTDVPGSSDVVWGAFVTYANDAKTRLLGVREDTLNRYGAVSRETVEAMTAGALEASGAGAAVAVSGVAGPGGGSAEKPVGSVWAGARLSCGKHVERFFRFPPPRGRVRDLSAWAALFLLECLVSQGDETLDILIPLDYI
jgi:PncC family amidohydrolase